MGKSSRMLYFYVGQAGTPIYTDRDGRTTKTMGLKTASARFLNHKSRGGKLLRRKSRSAPTGTSATPIGCLKTLVNFAKADDQSCGRLQLNAGNGVSKPRKDPNRKRTRGFSPISRARSRVVGPKTHLRSVSA